MGQIDFAFKHATIRERIFTLLSDQDWHSWRELHRICNRYGARIRELRRLGWMIVDVPDGEDGQLYKLISLEKGDPIAKRVRVYMSEVAAENAVLGVVTDEARSSIRAGLHSFKSNKDAL